MRAFLFFMLTCMLVSASTNDVITDMMTSPIDKINEHLHDNYNLPIKKEAKLTGEVVKDITSNLIKTYTVIKIEF